MGRRERRRTFAASCFRGFVTAMLVLGRSTAFAGPIDPALRFQTTHTPHFVIHFHQREEALAARLAEIAESVHVRLAPLAGQGHDRRVTHVVLVDQTDLPNGSAMVAPWNAIYIYPAPPTGVEAIGNTGDWLEYVFAHEYAHIVHLDRSRGWARAARAVFGRNPVAFPNLALPLWQVEGFATFVESEGAYGRLHAGDFREVVDAAAREGRFERIDRVNGGLVDWPAGQGWYAYGGRFHEFLAAKYGRDRLAQLAEATAGRLPFFGAGAFREVFGEPLGQLWSEFRAEAARPPGAQQDRERLTTMGFQIDGPRAAADGTVYFTAADARRFPGIYRLRGKEPERVTSRYGGSGLTLLGDALVFDQLELTRGAALVSDLYVHDLASGTTRRLTRGARLVDPDASRDGRIAAVQVEAAARSLVVLDAERLLAVEGDTAAELTIVARSAVPDVVYAMPRWSPDGRTIAVERRRIGGRSAIAILDGDSLEEITAIGEWPAGRRVTPAWSADGRTVYFASDHDAGPFQIYAASLNADRRVERIRRVVAPGGVAHSPLPRPDGTVIYVGYTADGFDLFKALLDANAAATLSNDADSGAPLRGMSARPTRASAYAPWSTLAPRAWSPIVERRDGRWRAGAAVGGADVLARHAVAASATWALTTASFADGLAPRGRPDWSASYAYQRWQPVLFAAAQERTTLFQAAAAGGTLVPVEQREQQLDAGVVRPFRRVRWTQSALLALHVERIETRLPGEQRRADRNGVRAAWTFNSARRYGYSISLEDGFSIAGTAEVLSAGLGADGDAQAFTADARVYLPLGLPHAVAAIRGAGATSRGDASVRRAFRLGGVDSNAGLGAFGSDAVSLLRGFQERVFVGRHVALVNAEARVPIAWPQRGLGTWPIFLRALHATAFADVGHAWTDAARWGDRKIGYGAELSADVVAGFGLPLTLTAGIAWGRDGASVAEPGREIYFRAGRAF